MGRGATHPATGPLRRRGWRARRPAERGPPSHRTSSPDDRTRPAVSPAAPPTCSPAARRRRTPYPSRQPPPPDLPASRAPMSTDSRSATCPDRSSRRAGRGPTTSTSAARRPAPDWERPRRYEAYPTIKTRMGVPAIPRLAGMAAAVAMAAVALFFLPATPRHRDDATRRPPLDLPSPSPSRSIAPDAHASPDADRLHHQEGRHPLEDRGRPRAHDRAAAGGQPGDQGPEQDRGRPADHRSRRRRPRSRTSSADRPSPSAAP